MLVEGVGINATARVTDVSNEAVLKLLADMGYACIKLHDERVRGLKAARIACDEIWPFVHRKSKHVVKANAALAEAGECWAGTAIDTDSKLVVSYLTRRRSPGNAAALMLDLAGPVTNSTQITTA